jgi:hypothetical protein
MPNDFRLIEWDAASEENVAISHFDEFVRALHRTNGVMELNRLKGLSNKMRTCGAVGFAQLNDRMDD